MSPLCTVYTLLMWTLAPHTSDDNAKVLGRNVMASDKHSVNHPSTVFRFFIKVSRQYNRCSQQLLISELRHHMKTANYLVLYFTGWSEASVWYTLKYIGIPPCFTTGKTFVTSCLLLLMAQPFLNGVQSKTKKTPRGANYFFKCWSSLRTRKGKRQSFFQWKDVHSPQDTIRIRTHIARHVSIKPS